MKPLPTRAMLGVALAAALALPAAAQQSPAWTAAKAPTAELAIEAAIAKCEAELAEYVRKNYRYSPEIQNEFVRV